MLIDICLGEMEACILICFANALGQREFEAQYNGLFGQVAVYALAPLARSCQYEAASFVAFMRVRF